MEPRGEVLEPEPQAWHSTPGSTRSEVWREVIHHLVLLEWEYLYLLLYQYHTSISTCKLGQGSYHLSGECQALQEITR